MTRPPSKMLHPHAWHPPLVLLVSLLLLLLLLPPLSQSAAASTSSPRSADFWRRVCGFFCPHQPGCDSPVYLSRQQQLDLLHSQEFLDILELFPQVLLENHRLQHTTLVRLEDNQRDLILLKYKDFFHPRETLPLARQKIVTQFAEGHRGLSNDVHEDGPPSGTHSRSNEIYLTESQVQELLKNSAGLETNHIRPEAPHDSEELSVAPDWNAAVSFLRKFVHRQRMRLSMQEQSTGKPAVPPAESDAGSINTGAQSSGSRSRDSEAPAKADQLPDNQAQLSIDQLLSKLKRARRPLDLDGLETDTIQSLDGSQASEPKPHRTKEGNQTVLSREEKEEQREEGAEPSRTESSAETANRISDRKSAKRKEPLWDSQQARTFKGQAGHRQSKLPSAQQILTPVAHSKTPLPSSATPSRKKKLYNKNGYPRRADLNARRYLTGGSAPDRAKRAGEAEEERQGHGSQQQAKPHSRRKREILKIDVCPSVEAWSNLVLAQTANGSLVQVAQFPEMSLEQWFLEEQCLYSDSPIVNGVTCEIRDHLVNAVIIPLENPSQPIQMSQIKVSTCTSIFNLDMDQMA